MSYNQLTSVPHIEPLALSLWSLDLRSNHITTVEPYTFSNFTALSRLYLLNNSLSSLSDFALNMPHALLYAVHLEASGLATLDDFAFSGLDVENLQLDCHALTEFPCSKDIKMLECLYLNNNPISRAAVDCSPRWNTIRLVQLEGTLLTSVDNITKYATSLEELEVGGSPVTFTDETFKGTRFKHIILKDVTLLPQFHSSKLTLEYLELGGIAVHCIDDVWLDGMANLQNFRLIDTSIDLLPNSRCSNNTYENRTVLGYFRSLHFLHIKESNLIQFPDLTKFGSNASLRYLYIRGSKISLCPVFLILANFMTLTESIWLITK